MLALAAYIVVDILSTRNPFHVFVSYLTFSPESAYNRILIWRYGTASVGDYPFFGVGFGYWARPDFMSGSMDNFWLVHAVSFGLPNAIAFVLAITLLLRAVGRVALTDKLTMACRSAYLVSMGGMIFAGMTVHYWNAMYIWFLFLLGSGAWILREEGDSQNDDGPSGKRRGRARRAPGAEDAADQTKQEDPAPDRRTARRQPARRR